MLMASVDDLKYYAVPSKNITLRKKRGEKNCIKDMFWHKPYEPPTRDAAVPAMGSALDTNFLMCNMSKRNARQLSNTTVKIPPIKLKLGFTGALFKYNDEDQRKLIAVLTVTWARNWDMLGYIQVQTVGLVGPAFLLMPNNHRTHSCASRARRRRITR